MARMCEESGSGGGADAGVVGEEDGDDAGAGGRRVERDERRWAR